MDIDREILKELITGCPRDKRRAQRAFYKMHYSFSMGVCVRYTNSIEQAKEVMNDGFIRVFKHIDKFDSNRPFQPWLKRILINCSIDNHNNEQNRIKEEDFEKAKNIEYDDYILDDMSYREMLGVMRELPPAYQAVFNLRVIEGYKHGEIAKMLDISIGTSKSNFSRARESLRKRLNTYYEMV